MLRRTGQPGNMPDLSILIVSWNTRPFLARCLASIEAELLGRNSFQTETIVVDNGSSDGTVNMVRTQFPWVQLIEAETNLGFAGGNRVAFEAANGKYVLLLNPDTEILPGALTGLVHFMDGYALSGAVGPALLNLDQTLQISTYPEPTLGRELWLLLHLDRILRLATYPLQAWRMKGPRTVDVVQGACMLLRGEALKQVGFLDEGYFMYTEEVDLCLRLRQAGWKIYWVPTLQVIHHGGQSTSQVSKEMFIHLYDSKLRYFRKHYGVGGALVYKSILTLAAMVRMLLLPLAVFQRRERRARYLRLAENYARLLLNLPWM